MKTKNIIVLIVALLIMLLLGVTKVNAESIKNYKDEYVLTSIDIEDKDGNDMGYMPPQSGGYGEIINTEQDFSDCVYHMYVENNYGDKIETELGTFIFKSKVEHEDAPVGSIYHYYCPVKPEDIKNKNGDFEMIFNATNVDTGKKDTLYVWIYFYKIGFKNNANLKVGDTDFIVNGKVVKDINEEGTAIYREHNNTLDLLNYKGTITYSNMGSTFNIKNVNNTSSYTVTCEDTSTGIKLDTENANLPKTVELVVNEITEGTTYNQVKDALKDIASKFYIFDISLQNNNSKFQPTSNVGIIIPIPEGIDTAKIIIYRIADNGEKTEYKPTIETVNNTKYAKIDTDHFSTYVLAEKADANTSNTGNTQDTNKPTTGNNSNGNKLDETPKTGTLNIIVTCLAVLAIASITGVIILKKK